MAKVIIILSLFFLLFISCDPLNDQHIIKIEKYKNGVTRAEISIIDDTLRDGTTKLYYENSVLGDEINYKNGFEDGWWFHYYKTGNLQSKRMFNKGVQNGPAYFFYKNGKLEHKEFWLNGRVFGYSYWYYPNGILDNYAAIDFQGHKRYIIEYDSIGNKTREEGTIIGQIASNGVIALETDFVDSIESGKPFHGSISIATPPGTIIKASMISRKNNGSIDTINLAIVNNMADFMRVFTKKGLHPITFLGEMFDSTGKMIKYDKARINVIVR